ncbi:MAG: hypothetical protein WBX01_14875 [Nitrososphaeraceae archaeon]
MSDILPRCCNYPLPLSTIPKYWLAGVEVRFLREEKEVGKMSIRAFQIAKKRFTKTFLGVLG